MLEYPKDVLAAKRLMTDFFPPIGTTKQAREKVPATDVAFVERGQNQGAPPGKREWTTEPPGECYCCGKRHPGGYLKCKNLSEGARRRMTKMVDAGHFDSFPPEVEGKPTKKNLRKGTALVAAEDKSESEGEDEKLALPSLEELLREQGYIHLNIGAEIAWDGDTVSDT